MKNMSVFYYFFYTKNSFFLSNCSHEEAKLMYKNSLLNFKDSGVWDFCLNSLFDMIMRVFFIFSLMPLTEYGWGESAVSNFWQLFLNFNFLFFFNTQKTFNFFLESLLKSLNLILFLSFFFFLFSWL